MTYTLPSGSSALNAYLLLPPIYSTSAHIIASRNHAFSWGIWDLGGSREGSGNETAGYGYGGGTYKTGNMGNEK